MKYQENLEKKKKERRITRRAQTLKPFPTLTEYFNKNSYQYKVKADL